MSTHDRGEFADKQLLTLKFGLNPLPQLLGAMGLVRVQDHGVNPARTNPSAHQFHETPHSSLASPGPLHLADLPLRKLEDWLDLE